MSPAARAFNEFGLVAPTARVPIPDQGAQAAQSFATLLDAWARLRPDAEALVGRHARYRYAALARAVRAATAGLWRLGLRPGDRVAASTGNHPDIVIAFLAAQRIGAVWLGINRQLATPEKIWMLRHAGACLLLAERKVLDEVRGAGLDGLASLAMNGDGTDDDWSALLARNAGAADCAAPDPDPWAPAMISYTSGTTGTPKGVVHSQHNAALIGAAAVARGQWDIGLRRGTGQPLTINNIMIRFATASLYAGASFVCMDRLDAAGTIEWVVRERIQAFSAVPTMIHDLLSDPTLNLAAMTSLVRPIVGGAGLPDSLRARYRAVFGTDLQFSYGLTEAPTGVTQTEPDAAGVVEPAGSSGRALPHLRVAIVDPGGTVLPAGSEGEIVIGPQRTGPWAGVYTPALGIWNDAAASARLLEHGWLHTGDIGVLDAKERLFVRARKSDLIVRGGANVYPAEVEQTLMREAGVRAAAVLGLPDARLGERVAVVLELQSAPDAAWWAAVYANCLAAHARYKVPVEWYVTAALPRNAMGKVIKPELCAEVLAGEYGAPWCVPERA